MIGYQVVIPLDIGFTCGLEDCAEANYMVRHR